jgi:phospholipid/cholesterol/gamma-HCH transport system substrate-binding protein
VTAGRSIKPSVVGVVLFLALAVAIFVQLLGYAGVSLAPASTYDISAMVPSAVNMIPHADVREAGIVVGQVSSIQIQGDAVRLNLEIERRYAPIYANATVLIRGKSLAQENYVSLDPGNASARALRAGAVLPLSQAPESVQLDQLLSTFTPKRRAELQRILDALGIGLTGNGQNLNQFIDGSSASARYGLPIAQVLDADREQVAAMISEFDRVASGLASRGQALRTVAHDERALSSAVAARDTELEDTLAALPPFLSQAQTTLDRMGSFSTDAVPVIHNLRTASVALLPAMTHLASAADATRRAVYALGRFAPRGQRMLDALATFAPIARRFMGPLETMLRQTNPTFAYLVSYAPFFGWAVSNLAATVAPYDAKSHLDRGIEMYGPDTIDNVSPSQRAAIDALTQAGALEPFSGPTYYNPYPPPGNNVVLKPWSGSYPRIQEDPPYPMPRRP